MNCRCAIVTQSIRGFSTWAQEYISNENNWPKEATGVCQDPDGELKFFSGLVEPKFRKLGGCKHWDRRPSSRINSIVFKDFSKDMNGDSSKAMVWKHKLFVNLEEKDMGTNHGLVNFSKGAIKFLSVEENWPDKTTGVCQDIDGWLKFYDKGQSVKFITNIWTRSGVNSANYRNRLKFIGRFKREDVSNPAFANVLKGEIFGSNLLHNLKHFSDEAAAFLKVGENWPEGMVGVCQDHSGLLKFYGKDWQANFEGIRGWKRTGWGYINIYKFKGTTVHNDEFAHVFKRNVVAEVEKISEPLPYPSLLHGFTEEVAKFLAVESNWPEKATGACQDYDGIVKFYISKKSAHMSDTSSVWIRPNGSYKMSSLYSKKFTNKNPNNKDAHVRRSELFANPLRYFNSWAQDELKKEKNWPAKAVVAYQNKNGTIVFASRKGVAETSNDYWQRNGHTASYINKPSVDTIIEEWKRAHVERNDLFVKSACYIDNPILSSVENNLFEIETLSPCKECGKTPQTISEVSKHLEIKCSCGRTVSAPNKNKKDVIEYWNKMNLNKDNNKLPTFNTHGVWYPVYSNDEFNLQVSGLREHGVSPKVMFDMALRSHEYKYVSVDKIKMVKIYNESIEMGWCLVNGQKYDWRGD